MISDKEMTDMIADARTRREGFEVLCASIANRCTGRFVILSSLMKMPMMCCRILF